MLNIKVRLKNKVFLLMFIPILISFIYTVLGMIGIVPSVAKGELENVLIGAVEILALLGIINDPTTKGLADSERAMTYEYPKGDDTNDEKNA